MGKVRPSASFRDSFQLLAVIGGVLLVYLGLTEPVSSSAQFFMIFIGGATAVADTWFLVRT